MIRFGKPRTTRLRPIGKKSLLVGWPTSGSSLGHHQRAEDGEGHDHDDGEALQLGPLLAVLAELRKRGFAEAAKRKMSEEQGQNVLIFIFPAPRIMPFYEALELGPRLSVLAELRERGFAEAAKRVMNKGDMF